MPGNHIDTGSQNLLGKVEKKRMINAQTSFKHSNSYRQENILILLVIINFIFFFQACERTESSKSCNLIGSESRRYFTILPANLGGIVGSFIHKFVCCLWKNKNRRFQTIFLLKLALLLALAREKWILLFRQKIWRENQASQPGKPLK